MICFKLTGIWPVALTGFQQFIPNIRISPKSATLGLDAVPFNFTGKSLEVWLPHLRRAALSFEFSLAGSGAAFLQRDLILKGSSSSFYDC